MKSKAIINYNDKSEIYLGHNITTLPSNEEYKIHVHDAYELYFLLEGDVTYYIEGQTYKLKPKDILMINNKELHRPYFDSNSKYERMIINFNPDAIAAFNCNKYNIIHAFEKRKLGFYNKIDSSDVEAYGLDKDLKELEGCFYIDCAERPISLKVKLISILIKINKIHQERFSEKHEAHPILSSQDDKIHSILEYINNNLNEKITLDLLQNSFYVNKYYLCHVFKKSTGFTIFEYITYKRIMKAKELLRAKLPINEVYVEVGFEDYSNFYKVFKRILGVSPREFQNS
jgi:AraC-like DNA-binding protein